MSSEHPDSRNHTAAVVTLVLGLLSLAACLGSLFTFRLEIYPQPDFDTFDLLVYGSGLLAVGTLCVGIMALRRRAGEGRSVNFVTIGGLVAVVPVILAWLILIVATRR